MRFFDTLSRKYIDLPADKPVNIYVCGITPYEAAHLGHIFTFVTYDLLARRLEDSGLRVRMVRNITDVDEPIFVKAKENNEAYEDLARRETEEFHSAMEALNMRPPDAEPRVSEYIPHIAVAVERLLQAGYGYKLDQDIYFDTAKTEDFGQLSKYTKRLMLSLMADRGGDPKRPGKRQPLDFLLWRGITDPADTAAWETPLGRGRPGWHIECSVMGADTLTSSVDIHGGGTDLVFPHHDAEIVQNEALGRPGMVKSWLHVAPMGHAGDKMSKSLGNLIFARDLIKKSSPQAVRLAILNYQHRSGGEWVADRLISAQALEKDLRAVIQGGKLPDARPLLEKVRAALDDDLNAPHALGCIRKYADAAKPTTENYPGADAHLRRALRLVGVEF